MHVVAYVFSFVLLCSDHLLEMDNDLETCLADSQDEYEGKKDAARALMFVKQILDGARKILFIFFPSIRASFSCCGVPLLKLI